MGVTKIETSATSKDASNTELSKKSTADSVVALQLGVFKVLLAKEKPFDFNFRHKWKGFATGLPHYQKILRAIYKLDSCLFICYVISKLWDGVHSAIQLYISSQLLRTIEMGLKQGFPDRSAIIRAIIVQVVFGIVVTAASWFQRRVEPEMKTRARTYFEFVLMEGRLRLDLPTSKEHQKTRRVTAYVAWDAFDGTLTFTSKILETCSQLLVIIESSYNMGDSTFLVACLAKPLYCTTLKVSLWQKAHVVSVNNNHYQRMLAMERLTTEHHIENVISSDIGGYILSEYRKADVLRDGASDEWVEWQYYRRMEKHLEWIKTVLGDLPLLYCAVSAILRPNTFTMSSIAIMQQSSSTLRYSLEAVLNNSENFRKHLKDIQNLYAGAEVTNTLKDGQNAYKGEKSNGMGFELADVTFAYPGSQSKGNALEKVNLSIKAGQLVVIVGQNGSGKSTFIKLLSRLYDATTGTIKLDGEPIQSYRLADLRRHIAILTQDHQLFPLSLKENIGLGNPSRVDDLALINASVEKGGAGPIVNKLEQGLDTILDPMGWTYGDNLVDDPEDPLQIELARLEKKIEVSGGERQRLVASRTFMRFSTDNIKLVLVDEPSSALDPEGEAQLFQNLCAARKGKTMIFVTHRFGHLTKHADMIVCMKEGSVVESGKHDELMKLEGEYAKLYNIQASAFVDDVPYPTTESK